MRISDYALNKIFLSHKKICLFLLGILAYCLFGLLLHKEATKQELSFCPQYQTGDNEVNNGFTKNGGVDISDSFWADFYGSNDFSGNDIIASYVSDWYISKTSVVSIFVSGYFEIDGLSLYVERDDGKRLSVEKSIGQSWIEYKFSVPINHKFRIVADDNFIGSFGWIGFSVPMYRTQRYIIANDLLILWDIPLFAILSILWFLPGYAFSCIVIKNGKGDIRYINLIAFTFESLVSLLLLYGRLFIGSFTNYIIIVYFIISIFYLCKNLTTLRELYRNYNFFNVWKYILFLLFLYSTICFAYELQPNFSSVLGHTRRFMATVDNEFPLQFAKNVLAHLPGKELFGWAATSRPPLLSSMFLFLCPFLADVYWDKFYLVFSILMQLSVWFSLDILINHMLDFSHTQKLFFKISFALAPVVILNCCFSWPKFQSATFFLFMVISIYKWNQKIKMSFLDSFIFGTACALAMLSHGSIAYAIVALAFYFLIHGKIDWRNFAVIFVSFALFFLPWSLISDYIDSNPNRDILLRYYFGGSWKNDGTPLLDFIIDSYKNIGLKHWFKNRIGNITCLFPRKLSQDIFANIYMNIKWTLFVNLGANALLIIYFFKKQCHNFSKIERYFLTIFLFTVIIQDILIFNGKRTIIQNTPYSNICFMFIIISIFFKHMSNFMSKACIFFLNIIPIFYIYFTKGEILICPPSADVFFRIRGGGFVIFLLILIVFLFYIFRENINEYVKQKKSQ